MTATPEPRAESRAAAVELPAVIHLPDLSRDVPPLKARRGSDTRQRRHVEQFRADDAEHAALEARARDSGLKIGAYVRACALGDAGPRSRRQSRLPAIDAKELARNNAELNWIGSNLNQAVRALNEIALNDGGGLAEVAHLTQPIERVLDELRLTLAANRRALGHDREG
jgi:hypothetical protein